MENEKKIVMTRQHWEEITSRIFRLGKEFGQTKSLSQKGKIASKAYDLQENPFDKNFMRGRKTRFILD